MDYYPGLLYMLFFVVLWASCEILGKFLEDRSLLPLKFYNSELLTFNIFTTVKNMSNRVPKAWACRLKTPKAEDTQTRTEHDLL